MPASETFGLWGIKFFGDTKGLKVDIDKAVGMVGGAATSVSHTLRNVLTAVAGLAGAGGLIALFESAVNTGEEITKLSQRVAISAETLSGYRLAASFAEVSMDDFARALQFGSKNMLAATQGTSLAGKAFEEMGIKLTDSNGKLKSVEEVMLEVADHFSKMEDGARKTGYAMEIFGRGGARMIPMLNQGRAALEAQRKEAELFGATFTTTQARAAEEFNINLKRIEAGFAGMRNMIVQSLLPFMNEMIGGIIASMKEWAASGELRAWAKATSDYIIDAFVAAARGMGQIALVVPVILDGFRILMAGIRFAETVFEAAIGGILKTIEKVSAGLAWWAELWGDPWAQKLRSIERATRDWGDTATTAAVQAADAAGEWIKAIGSSDETAQRLARTLSGAALKIEVWGKKAKTAGADAAKGIEDTTKKLADAPTLEELLKVQEGYLKAARTRGEATYQDELDFLRKRVEATREGTAARMQAEAEVFRMAQDIADRIFAHEQSLGLRSIHEEINRQKQKVAAAVQGSEARMKAEEDVFKKEEDLRNKRQSAALGMLGEAKTWLEEKGYDVNYVTRADVEMALTNIRAERGGKAFEAQSWAAGRGGMRLEDIMAGYQAAGQLNAANVLQRELGGVGEVLAGGAEVGAGPATAGLGGVGALISSKWTEAMATVKTATDDAMTYIERRSADAASRVAVNIYRNLEDFLVRKLIDQAARS